MNIGKEFLAEECGVDLGEEIYKQDNRHHQELVEIALKSNQEYQDLQTVKGWLDKRMEIIFPAEDHDGFIWVKKFKKECDRRQDEIRRELNK